MPDSIFRALVLALLVLNLLATGALWLEPSSADTVRAASGPAATDEADTAAANQQQAEMEAMAARIQAAFNQRDGQALYDLYGDEARAKLTPEQVSEQVDKLAVTFGEIEQLRYLNFVELGQQAGQTFLQVHFAADVSGPGLRGAQMVLHVIEKGDGSLSLYGMRLNAGQS